MWVSGRVWIKSGSPEGEKTGQEQLQGAAQPDFARERNHDEQQRDG